MSEEDMILEEADETSDVINDQLDILFYINEMDHSALYDDWNEQKIVIISRAMKIIAKSQAIILKNLK